MLVLAFTPGILASAELLVNIVQILMMKSMPVHMTLTEIAKSKEQNIGIFTDSQTTIRAISSLEPSKNSSVLECQFLIDFSFPSCYVWGTLVIVQISNIRFLANLRVWGSGKSKKHKISIGAGVR